MHKGKKDSEDRQISLYPNDFEEIISNSLKTKLPEKREIYIKKKVATKNTNFIITMFPIIGKGASFILT